MNDDWRLRVDLREAGLARDLSEHLEASELARDLHASFHDRVVVSVDGPEVFCYAGTQEQAEAAEKLIRSVAAEHGWQIESELTRWHPIAEEWENPDRPLPEGYAERAAERAELAEREREESAERGYPEFEVRVQCRSRGECAQFAQRLRNEGLPTLHRAHFLLVGAADEESASVLAERIRGEAPEGSTVSVEGTLRAVYDDRPFKTFAVFGGLGG
jgi:hypothetical protein